MCTLLGGSLHRVINNEQYNRANHSDNQAVNVEPGHARCPKEPEDEPSHDGANDPQNDVKNNPLA